MNRSITILLGLLAAGCTGDADPKDTTGGDADTDADTDSDADADTDTDTDADTDTDTDADTDASVRLVNVSQGAGTVDVYVEPAGNTPKSPLATLSPVTEPLNGTGYLPYPTSVDYDITVTAENDAPSSPLVDSRDVVLGGSGPQALAVIGFRDQLGKKSPVDPLGLLAVDESAVVPAGMATVTFVHAGGGIAPVDVLDSKTNAILADDLAYGTQSAAVDLAPGTYTIALDLTADDLTTDEDLAFAIEVEADRYYTAYAVNLVPYGEPVDVAVALHADDAIDAVLANPKPEPIP